MTRDDPIADAELAPLFASLEPFDALVLAVSGGADSTALLHLVARWMAQRRRAGDRVPAVAVATVDHRLRAAAAEEAARVAAAAGIRGLPHVTLPWLDAKPGSGLQEAARAARYGLLGDHLRSLPYARRALVTAHTADDQAETVLMRLARGSGLDGLAAMPAQRRLAPGQPESLLRPLLGMRKARLVATLAAAGVPWSDDPSNENPEFERVRLRESAGAIAELGLTPEKLALSASRLARARVALDEATEALAARVLTLHAGAYAGIDRGGFAAAPEELRLRLLVRVLAAFGGTALPPRLARVEGLMQRLAAATALQVTLGGCVVAAKGNALLVVREPGRGGLPTLPLSQRTPVLWDDRFLVTVTADNAGSTPPRLTVGPLTSEAYATIRRQKRTEKLPTKAAVTLPAVWAGSVLLAVPSLDLCERHVLCSVWPEAHDVSFHADFVGLPGANRDLGQEMSITPPE